MGKSTGDEKNIQNFRLKEQAPSPFYSVVSPRKFDFHLQYSVRILTLLSAILHKSNEQWDVVVSRYELCGSQ